jgi:hypothetical protein
MGGARTHAANWALHTVLTVARVARPLVTAAYLYRSLTYKIR